MVPNGGLKKSFAIEDHGCLAEYPFYSARIKKIEFPDTTRATQRRGARKRW